MKIHIEFISVQNRTGVMAALFTDVFKTIKSVNNESTRRAFCRFYVTIPLFAVLIALHQLRYANISIAA